MLNNIEAERVRNNLTKEEMANNLNVTKRTYFNWINEKNDIPSSALLKMSKIFGTSIDYLIKGNENTS